jgi:hypothetical protein
MGERLKLLRRMKQLEYTWNPGLMGFSAIRPSS